MKLFTAGLVTETSDITPIATTEADWTIEYPSERKEGQSILANMLALFKSKAKAQGWEVAESICASALPPGGRTITSVYEKLRDTILDDLQKAMPVNGVLLQLHGAAMAHGYDDCEGDLLSRIRAMVGDSVTIGVELDPHCHLSQAMLDSTDLMVFYKTFLHTDIEERAVELFELFTKTVEGEIQPVMAVADCKMIDFFDEAIEPMKSFYNKVIEREHGEGILSIAPIHGFPLADVPDMGSKVLVITDNNSELAQTTANELAMEFYQTKGQMAQYGGADTVLDRVAPRAAKGEMEIKLLEWSDLVGCGFPTDGTELIGRMLARGITNFAAAILWDPMAVTICKNAGEGSELMLRIGGKASTLSGAPLDLRVEVLRLYPNAAIDTWVGEMQLGDVAVVRSGDTEIILAAERVLGYNETIFDTFGIDRSSKQYLIFKYNHRCDDVEFVYGSSFDYRNWDFVHISRPKWPWDDYPFGR